MMMITVFPHFLEPSLKTLKLFKKKQLCETLVGPHLPQLEVRVVGGGDLVGKATQVSVVNGVSGRETSLD